MTLKGGIVALYKIPDNILLIWHLKALYDVLLL